MAEPTLRLSLMSAPAPVSVLLRKKSLPHKYVICLTRFLGIINYMLAFGLEILCSETGESGTIKPVDLPTQTKTDRVLCVKNAERESFSLLFSTTREEKKKSRK